MKGLKGVQSSTFHYVFLLINNGIVLIKNLGTPGVYFSLHVLKVGV